jgi:hypothetical protein
MVYMGGVLPRTPNLVPPGRLFPENPAENPQPLPTTWRGVQYLLHGTPNPHAPSRGLFGNQKIGSTVRKLGPRAPALRTPGGGPNHRRVKPPSRPHQGYTPTQARTPDRSPHNQGSGRRGHLQPGRMLLAMQAKGTYPPVLPTTP